MPQTYNDSLAYKAPIMCKTIKQKVKFKRFLWAVQALQGVLQLSVTVNSGPGITTDWVGMFPAGAPDSGDLEWKYLINSKTNSHLF